MPIIFNEREHAKEILRYGTQTTQNKVFELQLVASYLREQGYNDKQIETELHKVAKKSFNDYNKVKFYEMIDRRVALSKKKRLKEVFPIKVTQAEIDTILKEKDVKCQKLMFVYLVLAKYYMLNNNSDKYYVSCSDRDIFNLCDMYAKRSEQKALTNYLTVKGYIEPTLRMSSIVKYINENSEMVLEFVPDTDMVYYFEQKYLDGIFIKCANCGKLVKKTNNRVKYCRECALRIKNNHIEKPISDLEID